MTSRSEYRGGPYLHLDRRHNSFQILVDSHAVGFFFLVLVVGEGGCTGVLGGGECREVFECLMLGLGRRGGELRRCCCCLSYNASVAEAAAVTAAAVVSLITLLLLLLLSLSDTASVAGAADAATVAAAVSLIPLLLLLFFPDGAPTAITVNAV